MLDELLVVTLVTLYALTTIGLVALIGMKAEDDNLCTIGYFIGLKKFIVELFSGKNYFGIVLSTIAFIITIPSIVFIILSQVLMWFFALISAVWDLGNKKDNK